MAMARVQRFAKALPPALLAEDQRIADELSRSNASPREKLGRIYQLIDAFSDAAQPYTPCQSGCGACCRMNVAITSLEAERLAEFSGRMPATLAGPVAHAPSDFSGVPCPFLVEERCSVYEVRPLACRSHRTFDVDNYWCQPERAADAILAQVKLPGLTKAYTGIVAASALGGLADIRDYFA